LLQLLFLAEHFDALRLECQGLLLFFGFVEHVQAGNLPAFGFVERGVLQLFVALVVPDGRGVVGLHRINLEPPQLRIGGALQVFCGCTVCFECNQVLACLCVLSAGDEKRNDAAVYVPMIADVPR
jgi:hypothetical protein